MFDATLSSRYAADWKYPVENAVAWKAKSVIQRMVYSAEFLHKSRCEFNAQMFAQIRSSISNSKHCADNKAYKESEYLTKMNFVFVSKN